jgi:hypothetical protein
MVLGGLWVAATVFFWGVFVGLNVPWLNNRCRVCKTPYRWGRRACACVGGPPRR